MNMQISKRNFLKSSAGLLGAAALEQSGLMSLKVLSPSEAQAMQADMGKYTVRYTADVMCPAECGMEMWVQDGQVAKIYGNKAVPLNDGACCAKGASGQQLIYSPYRMKYPMIRTGQRGEGKFRRASWDEALDYIATRLRDIKKKYGAESVIMDSGDVTDRDHYWRLFFAFGSPNCTEHGAICDTPRRHGPKLMLNGKRIEPDIMRPQLVRQTDGSLKWDSTYKTKLIIYNGWNPFVATRIAYESRGTVAAQVEAGCKVVVIDPSLSNTAARADLWLAPRAGTDGDLFGAMLRYILENDNQNDPNKKYIDVSFKKYSVGWDEFEAEFKTWWAKKDPINGLSYFSAEWAADRTGLAAKQITDLSHQFGITKPAALVWGMQSPGPSLQRLLRFHHRHRPQRHHRQFRRSGRRDRHRDRQVVEGRQRHRPTVYPAQGQARHRRQGSRRRGREPPHGPVRLQVPGGLGRRGRRLSQRHHEGRRHPLRRLPWPQIPDQGVHPAHRQQRLHRQRAV